MQLASGYEFRLIRFRKESILETHHSILLNSVPSSFACSHCNDYPWVILWLRSTLLFSKPHKTLMLGHGAWWFDTVIAGTEWDPILFTKIST